MLVESLHEKNPECSRLNWRSNRKLGWRHLGWLLSGVLLLSGVAAIDAQAQEPTNVQRYDFNGEVQSIDKAKKRATIKHEAVKGYMDAMTMPFVIKDEKALEEMQPGDQIRATLVVTAEGATWLETIMITASKNARAQTGESAEKPIGLMGFPGDKPVPPQLTYAQRYNDPAGLYTCPMHLNIRTKTPEKCPKCGMDLISVEPKIAEEFDLKFELSPKLPVPDQPLRIHLTVSNPRNGARVKEFALMHDRMFHLFLISQDLSDFQHIHPQQLEDGSFEIETMLKRPGLYKLYADFFPLEGAPQMLHKHFGTKGWRGEVVGGQAKLKPDTQLTKLAMAIPVTPANASKLGAELPALASQPASDLRVTLSFEEGPLTPGKTVTLKYHLTDTATGQPVRDLIPYLSAWGHTLILSDDQSTVVHSHPEEQVDLEKPIATQRGGPDVSFDALFPAPGMYRIWTQFLRGRQIFTVTFDLKVERL
ncbi:MAG: copper-binding protein [Blastocatellia bacterium]|nr:copper-binding protein [Blastocatellia bacterium]